MTKTITISAESLAQFNHDKNVVTNELPAPPDMVIERGRELINCYRAEDMESAPGKEFYEEIFDGDYVVDDGIVLGTLSGYSVRLMNFGNEYRIELFESEYDFFHSVLKAVDRICTDYDIYGEEECLFEAEEVDGCEVSVKKYWKEL